jgi:hypothetical protein
MDRIMEMETHSKAGFYSFRRSPLMILSSMILSRISDFGLLSAFGFRRPAPLATDSS